MIDSRLTAQINFLGRILWRSFVIQYKDQSIDQRLVGTVVFLPAIFTVLSVGTYMYGGRGDLGTFAIIGSGMIGIWNASLWNSGQILQYERRSATLPMLVAAPTSLMVILLGKSLFNATASLLAMGVTFLTGLLVFQLPIDIAHPFAFLGGLLLTLVAMTCMGLILGALFVLTRNAPRFLSVANYPIFLLSGLSFPLTLMPLWTRPLSALLAPRWGNLALSNAAGVVMGSIWSSYLWLVGLAVVYLVIARLLFRRVENLVRQAGTLESF